jgi:integrase
MPTLIKRTGSPYFIACFDVPQPDGSIRRLKKSTKRTKRDQALKRALELEAAEQKAGTATDETSSKAFAILTEAAEAAARGELAEGRARDLLARLTEISTGQPLRFFTVASWRDEWLAMKAASSKAATRRRYADHTAAFIAWLGDKANARLEAVTKSEIRAFRDAIREGWTEKPAFDENSEPILRQRTAKTVNHYAADVAGMFRAAARDGLIVANPAAALGKLPELDSTEREVFTVAEVGKLVEAADSADWQAGLFADDEPHRADRCADWQGMILVGFYSGARLGDCAHLTWGNVNLARKTLSFMPAKTERKRKRLEVPLHPRLLAWLKGRKAGTDETPIFPTLAKARAGGAGGLSAQFIRIMDAAEIDRRTMRAGEKGKQRAQHARSFHSLRHSLTSTLANLDVSEEIRRRITGHESAAVHSGYTHHERKTLARAVEKMPSV